ncbi:hypothetical protein N8873_05205 [Flavobacteriaceae bacterium]|nr:hypothetical protein [Flavobacteriaceae bacterium]
MNFSSRSRFLVQINIGRNFVDLISLALLTDGSISKVLLNLGVHSNQRISFSMSNTGEGRASKIEEVREIDFLAAGQA